MFDLKKLLVEDKFNKHNIKVHNISLKKISEMIFQEESAKIVFTCSSSGDKLYAIWAKINQQCYIAIFNIKDKKYNILGAKKCSNNAGTPADINTLFKLFHSSGNFSRYLDISKQHSVEEFGKILSKQIVKVELEPKTHSLLKSYADKTGEDIDKLLTKIIEDKVKKLI